MKNIIKRWVSSSEPKAVIPSVPPGERIYAVGDIHGSLGPLEQVHEMIRQDAENFAGTKTLVYLGDYIDRGDNSKEIIDLLLHHPLQGFSTVFLLGNHEQSLLDFLDHPRSVAAWLSYGGRATLHSYGVRLEPRFEPGTLEEIRDELAQALPQDHLNFFRAMKLYHLAGSYCFVHAGIRPGIAIKEQRNEDLLWIREDFTRSRVQHEHMVVHGHSITRNVDWNDNRIGIDTGAFHSGILTCLVLEEQQQRLLQSGEASESSGR